jgi:hypothetical protein
VAVVLAVAAAGSVELVYGPGSPSNLVDVTDTIGFSVAYAPGVPHYVGGPVCADCPVQGGLGVRILVTIWVDWVCPANGTTGINLTSVSLSGPFHLLGTVPGLPAELLAAAPSPASPGNGSWVSGDAVLTLVVLTPSAGGTYSLGGTISVQ